tara:strand:- start:453 stop:971 length:519 start_codon:yes stop_codon:yes gene_type:complete
MCQIIDVFHSHELEQWRSLAKRIVWNSFHAHNPIRETCPNQVSGLLKKMRLTDIRNRIAFSIYRCLNVAIDTSFERSYNANAPNHQIKTFENMAHGVALVKSAIDIATLNNVLQWTHLIKMTKQIQQITQQQPQQQQALHSCTVFWYLHIKEHGLSSLIWELFIDVYNYDQN